MRDLTLEEKKILSNTIRNSIFLNNDITDSLKIKDNSVNLVVTSPPFLDIINYVDDNWLRCWFNNISTKEMREKIICSKTIDEWSIFMKKTLKQLYRVVKKGGWVVFEVGEIRKEKIRLEEIIVRLGIEIGFICESVIINQQYLQKHQIYGVLRIIKKEQIQIELFYFKKDRKD